MILLIWIKYVQELFISMPGMLIFLYNEMKCERKEEPYEMESVSS